jgi:hypothetical protein
MVTAAVSSLLPERQNRGVVALCPVCDHPRPRSARGHRGSRAGLQHNAGLTDVANGACLYRWHAVASTLTSTTTNGLATAGITPLGRGSPPTAAERRHTGGSRTCSPRTSAPSITKSDLDQLEPMAAKSLDYGLLPQDLAVPRRGVASACHKPPLLSRS